jgi:uncharacterized protein YbaP (TraB family)
MKKYLFILILALIADSASAQLLWKISGNGLKQPSYLFGTHHLIPISFLDSVPGLYKAFNASEMIIGEMILSNVDATAMMQKAAIMPNHIKMKDLLDESDYNVVDAELKRVLKMGLSDLSILNPSLILTLYEMEIYKQLTGFSDDIKSDSYFQLVGSEKGKKMLGLETIQQQIALLFENGTLQRQAILLVAAIRQKDSALHEMLHLNMLYRTGAIDEMVLRAKKSGDSTQLTETEYAKIVDDRNTDWMTKLPAKMLVSSCFIAVGALHLGGEKGLVKLLQKAGFKVTAVSK